MNKLRVVVDTNVLVSGLISPHIHNPPTVILNLVKQKTITLILSEEIIDELEDVLKRPIFIDKYKINHNIRNSFIQNIHEVSHVIKPLQKIQIVPSDPEDDKFIECAVDGEANFIISGDKHLLSLKKYHGIEIVRPIDFLDRI